MQFGEVVFTSLYSLSLESIFEIGLPHFTIRRNGLFQEKWNFTLKLSDLPTFFLAVYGISVLIFKGDESVCNYVRFVILIQTLNRSELNRSIQRYI